MSSEAYAGSAELETQRDVTGRVETVDAPVTPATPVVTAPATAPAPEAEAEAEAAVDSVPSKSDKVKQVVTTVRAYANEYAYEVYAVSSVVSIAAFTILFPVAALITAGVVAATSGWVAYFGLRQRVKIAQEGK